MSASIINRIVNLVKFSRVSRAGADDKTYPTFQVSYLGKAADSMQVTPYGLYSNAPVDSQAITFSLQGDETKLVSIANDYPNRVKPLEEHEVALSNLKSKVTIKLLNSGELAIDCNNLNINFEESNFTGTTVIINANNITLGEGVEIDGSQVSLGGSGGQGVARVGDSILITDPSMGTGIITSGSSNVTSN